MSDEFTFARRNTGPINKAAPINKWQNTFFADSNATSEGDGSFEEPFQSLQVAINAAEALGSFIRKIIFVAAGSAFDENIVVSGGLMSIIGLGPFTIGDAVGSSFGSTTPRNFTFEIGDQSVDGKWPTIILGTILDDETSSTHTAYSNGVTISGDFLVTNPLSIVGVTPNIQLRNVKVNGNYDTSSSAPNGIQTYLRRCFFNNAFNSPSGLLNIVDSCEFDLLLNAAQYGRISNCEISGGMTVTGAPISPLAPNGITNTTFSGTFTGPAGSLLLDSITNYFFKTNGALLAGGATKVALFDTVL